MTCSKTNTTTSPFAMMDVQDLFQFPNSMVLIVPDRESFIKMSHWNIAFLVLGRTSFRNVFCVPACLLSCRSAVSNWINRVLTGWIYVKTLTNCIEVCRLVDLVVFCYREDISSFCGENFAVNLVCLSGFKGGTKRDSAQSCCVKKKCQKIFFDFFFFVFINSKVGFYTQPLNTNLPNFERFGDKQTDAVRKFIWIYIILYFKW